MPRSIARVFELAVPWWELVARASVVYVAVLALLRVAGKRELGQMTPFDLVVILVIANAVQNAMTGPDTSLVGGLIVATTIVALNAVVSRFRRQLPFFERALTGTPTLLVHDGEIIEAHLAREGVTREEVEMAAREHGIDDLKEVRSAVLEIDGSISVIPRTTYPIHRSLRRFRQFKNRP